MTIRTKIFLLVSGIVVISVLLYFLVILSILLYTPDPPLYNITISYQENFSINKNFEFNVGEKFMYKKINYIVIMKEDGTKEERILSIDPESYSVTEEIDNRYIILNERNLTMKTMFLGAEIFRMTRYINNTYICSKDGNVRDTKTNINFDKSFFINKWMLGLEENKTFEIKITIDNGTYIREFTTIGKENINGRECYKVKMISYSLEDPNYKYPSYYWIDTEKRILVKMEEYDGEGNKQREINLI